MEEIKAIIFDWIGTLYQRNKGLYKFSKEVLEILNRKYKLGLISKAQDIEKRKRELEVLNIEKYFNSVIISNEKGEEEFRKCFNELSILPKECFVVGDRSSREIHVGNKFGCQTIWIQKGDRSYDAPNKETGEPKYIINSIKDLLKLKELDI